PSASSTRFKRPTRNSLVMGWPCSNVRTTSAPAALRAASTTLASGHWPRASETLPASQREGDVGSVAGCDGTTAASEIGAWAKAERANDKATVESIDDLDMGPPLEGGRENVRVRWRVSLSRSGSR